MIKITNTPLVAVMLDPLKPGDTILDGDGDLGVVNSDGKIVLLTNVIGTHLGVTLSVDELEQPWRKVDLNIEVVG